VADGLAEARDVAGVRSLGDRTVAMSDSREKMSEAAYRMDA